MATLRSLRVMLFVDHSKVRAGMTAAEKEVRSGAKKMNKAIAGAMVAGGAAIGAGIWKSIQIAARRQKLEVSMAVLGGTKELMNEIRSMARKSSVPMDEWLQGSNRLLGAGIEVKEVASLMESMSNLAAGTGNSIKELGLVYSQVFSKGKLQGEEMLQFMERNVNLMPALMQVMKKSAAEIVEMQRKGLVTPDDVAKAMKKMTSGKGRFAGMDMALKQTLTGSFTNMTNRLSESLERMGKILIPAITQMMNELGTLSAPGGLFSSFGEALMVPLAILGHMVGTVTLLFNFFNTITFNLLGKMSGYLLAVFTVILSIRGAVMLFVSQFKRLLPIIRMITGVVMYLWGFIKLILIRITMIAAGITGGWAVAILAVVVTVVGLLATWWFRTRSDKTTEKLRKQQEIMKKNAKLAKQQGGAFGSGASFGSSEAASIIFGENKNLAIQRQQLEYLRMIAEKEDQIEAAELGSSNTRADGKARRAGDWFMDLSAMGV